MKPRPQDSSCNNSAKKLPEWFKEQLLPKDFWQSPPSTIYHTYCWQSKSSILMENISSLSYASILWGQLWPQRVRKSLNFIWFPCKKKKIKKKPSKMITHRKLHTLHQNTSDISAQHDVSSTCLAIKDMRATWEPTSASYNQLGILPVKGP